MKSDEFIKVRSNNCVDKNIQVVRKHRKTHKHSSRNDKVFTLAHQYTEESRHEHHKDYGRRCERHRSPCKLAGSSEENSSEDEHNRAFVMRKPKFTNSKNIYRHNSDISDYVTVMACENENCPELAGTESTTSASRRMSRSESNLQNQSGKGRNNQSKQKQCPPGPCYGEEQDDEGVCPHCKNLMRDTCPICAEGMIKLLSAAQVPQLKCACTSKSKKKKKDSKKNKCCKCSKPTNTEIVEEEVVDEELGRCPPCGLCADQCGDLRASPSEELILKERDATRCDCKTKQLKQRLLKAFNVCPKCRQPKYLCQCLEEMLIEYKQGGSGQGNADCCTCKKGAKAGAGAGGHEDSLAKLLLEVTNTCPKCGHKRRSCTCLEEMLWDVKRMLTKQDLAVEMKKGKKSCGCQCKSPKRCNDADVYFEGSFPLMEITGEPDCRGTQMFKRVSHSDTRMTKRLESTANALRPRTCPDCKKSGSSCECGKPVPICKKCKLPEIICECKMQTKGKKESREFHAKELSKKNRKKQSDVHVYCECSVENIPYDQGRVNICEECLRPKHNCVCKQSPTCFKCGKRKGDDADARRKHEFRQEAVSERSRSTRKHKHETMSARETTRHGSRDHTVGYQPSTELMMRVRDSKAVRSSGSIKQYEVCNTRAGPAPPSQTKYITVGPRPDKIGCIERLKNNCRHNNNDDGNFKKDDKGISSSQSAFQKLKSHFLRCRSCGKRHMKREYECRQLQYQAVEDCVGHKHISPDNKDRMKSDKGRKSEKESPGRERRKERSDKMNDSATKSGLVNVILPPQERNSDESIAEYGQEIAGK